MAAPDRPFSDTEKVNLLAEIIKCSSVPPERLLDIIYEYRVETQWGEIVRPPGRSPQACRQAFEDLRGTYQAPSQRPPAFYPAPPTSFIHRPYVPLDTAQPIAPGRNIQPRPHGVPPTQYSPTSSPYTSTPPEQTFKKRGRPTNAEKEQRKQEYEARGETYPPPRSRKRSKATSTSQAGGSPKTAVSAPLSAVTGEASTSSSKQGSYLGHSPRSPPYSQQPQAQAGLGQSPRVMEPPPTSMPRRQSPFGGDRPYQQQQPPPPQYPQYASQYSHSQPPSQQQSPYTPVSQQQQQPPSSFTSAPAHGMRLPRPISTSTPGSSSGAPPGPSGYARSHDPSIQPPPLQLQSQPPPPPPQQQQQQQQQQGGTDSGTSSGEPPSGR